MAANIIYLLIFVIFCIDFSDSMTLMDNIWLYATKQRKLMSPWAGLVQKMKGTFSVTHVMLVLETYIYVDKRAVCTHM